MMSKNVKKKKYKTRIEKNKRRYNNNYSPVKESKSNKLLLLILVVSLVFNVVFLIKNEDLNDSMSEQKDSYEKQLKELSDYYTTYLFLGDSITDFYDLDKYFEGMPVVNSGISGDTTLDILDNMKERVYDYKPDKVILLIGTNDLIHNISVEEVISNIEEIITKIKENEPKADIYVQSIYPVNDNLDEEMVSVRDNEDIMKINDSIEKYCQDHDCTYINMYDLLTDEDGNFNEEYTEDGLHPNDKCYEVITKELKKYLDA
mgnify:CR=1 FL=1